MALTAPLMEGMEEGSLEDLSSFVRSSKYRRTVVTGLARAGPATPTELAENTDHQRSHVSRAISELRESNVVELQVSEGRTVGRYYDLTETGEKLWAEIETELDGVSWDLDEPTTDTDDTILEIFHDELEDSLRFVGKYDGEHATMLYADPDAAAQYTDAELEAGIRELVYRRINMDLNVPEKRCWAQVFFFESEAILMVRPDGERLYSASFDLDTDIDVTGLADAIRTTVATDGE